MKKSISKILFSLVAFSMMLLPLSSIRAFTIDLPEIDLEDMITTDDSGTEVVTEIETMEELEEELNSLWDDADFSYSIESDILDSGVLGGLLGMTSMIIALVISLVFGLAGYIYMGVTMSKVAKHLKHENPWFAWIPILNIIQLFQMGDMNPWLILLVLIPGLGGLIVGVIAIIALMNICEKRGYDKALGLLTIIPIANLILLGMLAWGKKEGN